MELSSPHREGDSQRARLLIVDGHAFAYRAFHAIRSLSSPSGEPTNAIFGFIKSFEKLQGWLKSTHVVVAWDGGLAAERLALLPAYKADRPPMPTALEQQLDPMVAYLRAAGIRSVCRDGIEADDLIASFARQCASPGLQAVIASPDKDFMQLVDANIGLVHPNDAEPRIWNAEDVWVRTGVLPGQIVDYLSLVGDTVDNIAGVPGVGPKTAARLLQEHGSIEAMLGQLERVVPERVRQALTAAAAALRCNQEMIRLRDNLDLGGGVDALRPGLPDKVALRALFAGWGFRSMLAALGPETPLQHELF